MCDYPSPCDSCAELKDCRKGCQAWETRFRTIWKQFNMYPIRKYRMRGGKHKKFVYAHPDLIKKYLKDGPCKGCEFEVLCDVPCTAYWCWWDARMTAIKAKFGME